MECFPSRFYTCPIAHLLEPVAFMSMKLSKRRTHIMGTPVMLIHTVLRQLEREQIYQFMRVSLASSTKAEEDGSVREEFLALFLDGYALDKPSELYCFKSSFLAMKLAQNSFLSTL